MHPLPDELIQSKNQLDCLKIGFNEITENMSVRIGNLEVDYWDGIAKLFGYKSNYEALINGVKINSTICPPRFRYDLNSFHFTISASCFT